MVYVLVARNTDARYWDRDVRYREYTTSKVKAEAFRKIPKIQFSDSGHGIVFFTNEHKGPRKPAVRDLWQYVQQHLVIEKKPRKANSVRLAAYRKVREMVRLKTNELWAAVDFPQDSFAEAACQAAISEAREVVCSSIDALIAKEEKA